MRRSTFFVIIFFSISIIVSIFLLIITLFSSDVKDDKIDNNSSSIELINIDDDENFNIEEAPKSEFRDNLDLNDIPNGNDELYPNDDTTTPPGTEI